MVETGSVDEHGAVGLRRAVDDDAAIHLASDGILSAAYKCLPDVVLIVYGAFVSTELLDILRARGHRVVILHTEQPYQLAEEIARAPHADISILTDPTHLDKFQAIGLAYYQPHSYRPSVHYPGPPSPGMSSDFCFVGTGVPSRVQFLEAMDLDGLDVLLAGQWQMLEADSPLRKWLAHDDGECLDNDQTAQVYRSSRASLNLYRREAERPELSAGYAMSPRELEMAACGLWFARDPRPEGDELLPLPTFTSPEHASELLRWFLAHDGPRQAMADAAREAVAGRTFTTAAKRLLGLLDR
jgi:hypothetical protein